MNYGIFIGILLVSISSAEKIGDFAPIEAGNVPVYDDIILDKKISQAEYQVETISYTYKSSRSSKYTLRSFRDSPVAAVTSGCAGFSDINQVHRQTSRKNLSLPYITVSNKTGRTCNLLGRVQKRNAPQEIPRANWKTLRWHEQLIDLFH